MQSKYKYFLYAGVFFLFVLVGFGVSWLIKGCGKTTADIVDGIPEDTTILPPSPQGSGLVSPDTVVIKEDVKPITIIVDKQRRSNKGYTLQVHAENVPKTIEPMFRINSLGKKSRDGKFKDIPGCLSGKYMVTLVNNLTGEELASLEVKGFDLNKLESEEKETVSSMSAGEFQSLLLNQKDNSLLGGKNPKVARSVTIRTQGLNEGERSPHDILDVREKIANGIWSSARVVDVGYDKSGRINSVTIRPVY